MGKMISSDLWKDMNQKRDLLGRRFRKLKLCEYIYMPHFPILKPLLVQLFVVIQIVKNNPGLLLDHLQIICIHLTIQEKL